MPFDPKLAGLIDRQMPKMNPQVTEGLSYHQVTGNCAEYINRVIECAQIDFPDCFRYEGYSPVDPREEMYQSIFQKKLLSVSRSDMFLIKLNFSFIQDGEAIALPAKYVYLPTIRRGGLITINGTNYVVSATLSDNYISAGSDHIYIPMNKTKCRFYRLNHTMIRGDERVTSILIWSRIYIHRFKVTGAPRSNKMVTSCAHYLFSKFGAIRAFKEYAGVDIHIADSFDEAEYPSSEWTIYRSTGIKPRHNRDQDWFAPTVKIAMRTSDIGLTTESMIAAFFYVCDNFPDQTQTRVMDYDNPTDWLRLLGLIIMYHESNDIVILNQMKKHLASVDTSVDMMVADWLRADNIDVYDIYHLMYWLIENANSYIVENSRLSSCMYGKLYRSIRYVLMDIIKDIFNLSFSLARESKSNSLNLAKASKILHDSIRTGAIFRLTRQANHPEVSTLSSSTDNLIPKVTSIIKLQKDMSSSGKAGSGKAAATFTPEMFLDASIAECGTLAYNPSSDPTGRSRINPYIHLDENGFIVRNEKLVDVIDATQLRVRR